VLTVAVVYLSSDVRSLPARAFVGAPLPAAPPLQAARERARMAAAGTVLSHFRALDFIRITFVRSARHRPARQEGSPGTPARMGMAGTGTIEFYYAIAGLTPELLN
jgi:hypothetical protein